MKTPNKLIDVDLTNRIILAEDTVNGESVLIVLSMDYIITMMKEIPAPLPSKRPIIIPNRTQGEA